MSEYLIDENKNLVPFEIPQYIKTIELSGGFSAVVTVGIHGSGSLYWQAGTVIIVHTYNTINNGWSIYNVTGSDLWLFGLHKNDNTNDSRMFATLVPNMEYESIYSGYISDNDWWLLPCQRVGY